MLRLLFEVPGPPVPNARARKGAGGRWYTPPRTKAYRARVQWAALAALAKAGFLARGKWPLRRRFRVQLVIVPANKRRMDGDNVLKNILDALNKLLWADDSLVRRSSYDMRDPDQENPRVVVGVKSWKVKRG